MLVCRQGGTYAPRSNYAEALATVPNGGSDQLRDHRSHLVSTRIDPETQSPTQTERISPFPNKPLHPRDNRTNHFPHTDDEGNCDLHRWMDNNKNRLKLQTVGEGPRHISTFPNRKRYGPHHLLRPARLQLFLLATSVKAQNPGR
jgi:hypothetical protein